MAESTYDQTCGGASFGLTDDSTSELHGYLSQHCTNYNWINLLDKCRCKAIPPEYMHLLQTRPDFLGKVFDGKAFTLNLDLHLETILVCDAIPQVILMPKFSIFGNRMFLCEIDSAWYNFLLPMCCEANHGILGEIYVRTIDHLPKHILDKLKPRAQGLIDFSLIKFDGQALITSLFGHLHSLMDSTLIHTAQTTARAFGILLQIFGIMSSPSLVAVISLVYNLLLSLNLTFQVVQRAIEFLTPYFEDVVVFFAKPKAEFGNADFEPLVTTLVTSFVVILSLVMGGSIPDKSILNSSLKFAGTLGRSILGITTLSAFLTKYLVEIYDWCYYKVTKTPRDISSLKQYERDVASFISQLNTFKALDNDNMQKLRDDPTLRRQLIQLKTFGNSLRARLLETRIDAKGMRIFMDEYNKMETLCTKSEIYGGDGAGPRLEPLVVQFFGDSGCGKSHVPGFIASDVCDWENIDDHPMEHVYSRKTKNEYFDGYKPGKHIIAVYDDFGQGVDSQTNPNDEFMEIIYMCNIAEYQLHMASIAEKANTYFQSKLIILTSNEVSHNIQSLSFPEAFERRIDLRFKVSVDPKFTNSRRAIDQDLVIHYTGSKCSEHIYQFTPYYRVGEGRLSTFHPLTRENSFEPLILNYEQMISYLHESYDKKINHSQARIDAMSARFRMLRKRREHAEFKDASAELPKAQVNMSAVEQFLVCWYVKQGVPTDLFESFLEFEEESRIDNHRLNSRDVWTFVDDVVGWKIDIKFKTIEGSQVEINHILYSLNDDSYIEPLPSSTAVAYAKRITHSILDSVNQIGKDKWNLLKYLTAIITGTLALYKIFSIGKTMFFGSEIVQSEANVSGDVKTLNKSVIRVEGNPSGDVKTNARPVIRVEGNASGDVKTMAKQNIRTEGHEAQAYIDSNCQEVLSNVIIQNMYRIGGVGAQFSANIIFIQGRIALCNWHVIDFLKQHESIRISNVHLTTGYEFPYSAMKIVELKDFDGKQKDAVLVQFPKSVHVHKKIVNHFVRSQDISKFTHSRGILAGFVLNESSRNKNILYRVEPLSEIRARDSLHYEYLDGKREKWDMKIRDSYGYFSQTGAGDCGSVLLLNTPSIPRKICGIHVAGSEGHGFATSITCRDLETALLCFNDSVVDYVLPDCVDVSIPRAQCISKMPEGDFVTIGVSSEIAGSPGKSDIRPSPIHGLVLDPIHLPSVLRPFINEDGERVDPIMKGLKKCGVSTKWIPQMLVEMARDDYRSVLFKNTDLASRRLLTYEESISGVDGDEFIGPINRRSSPGFGWSRKAGGRIGKTKWLGSDDYILDNKELRTAVDNRKEMARQGVRAPHLWVDTLKVERRSIEKVREGKTRVFSVGQMDFNLLGRQMYSAFISHVMHNRIDNEIAVGINPYSTEWTELATHLNKCGDNVIAGDFSNYDGTLNSQIMYACLELINEWYDDGIENARIRDVIFSEIVSSIHICGDVVYQWTHSQPSGNFLTTILNSMYNSLAARIVYALTFGEIQTFSKNISMISYGDDNVLNIHPSIISEFNQFTISGKYEQIGMVYTDESKGKNEVVKVRKLQEVEFLKRGFIKRKGRYDAPLALDTIMEMVNWVRGDHEHNELCITNCETACLELALHDRSTFEECVSKIKRACFSRNLYPVIHTYDNFRCQLFLGQIGKDRGRICDPSLAQIGGF